MQADDYSNIDGACLHTYYKCLHKDLFTTQKIQFMSHQWTTTNDILMTEKVASAIYTNCGYDLMAP